MAILEAIPRPRNTILAMTDKSKIRVVLGCENWELVCKDLEEQKDLVVTSVALSDSANYYEHKARLLLVRDKQRVVRQIVLPSYHLEWIFYAEPTERNLEMARLMDLVWNFAGAVAELDTGHINYFVWKVQQAATTHEVKGNWVNMKGNDLWKVRVMLGWQRRSKDHLRGMA